MDYCLIAVFSMNAGLTHFLADFLTNWKKKKGTFFVVHCLLYTVFFTPVFWWLGVNFLLLIPIFCSHLIIDSQEKRLGLIVRIILKEGTEGDTLFPFRAITLGIDQILHLAVIMAIAQFI